MLDYTDSPAYQQWLEQQLAERDYYYNMLNS